MSGPLLESEFDTRKNKYLFCNFTFESNLNLFKRSLWILFCTLLTVRSCSLFTFMWFLSSVKEVIWKTKPQLSFNILCDITQRLQLSPVSRTVHWYTPGVQVCLCVCVCGRLFVNFCHIFWVWGSLKALTSKVGLITWLRVQYLTTSLKWSASRQKHHKLLLESKKNAPVWTGIAGVTHSHFLFTDGGSTTRIQTPSLSLCTCCLTSSLSLQLLQSHITVNSVQSDRRSRHDVTQTVSAEWASTYKLFDEFNKALFIYFLQS